MTSRRLTVYLLRSEVNTFDDALDSDKKKDRVSVEIDASTNIEGCFYYLIPNSSTPKWVEFVQPLLTNPLSTVKSASTAALLLLKTSGRIFALTFGYGRSLLDLSKIEYQFGLRVALNRIDPQQIRSLDSKMFEDLVVSTNKQASKSTALSTFDIDISRDILRSVSGEPHDFPFIKRLTGADSLVMTVEAKASELSSICDSLLTAYSADNYKTNFGWIDQLSMVRDEVTIENLNNLLLVELQNGTLGSTYLAMPEPIDWEDIDGFRVTGTEKHVYEDLDLDQYLNRLGNKRTTITLNTLKKRFVYVRFGRSGQFDKRWSLYQYIVSEQRYKEQLFVLIEGRWFAISETLVEKVEEYVSHLPESQITLPESVEGENEGQYNERVVQTLKEDLLKMDGITDKPDGATSPIEFCDILSADGNLIHVKRKNGSSTLSHLFSQGSVSAKVFVGDGAYRDKLRERIANHCKADEQDKWLRLVPDSNERVDRPQYCVTYVVIAKKPTKGHPWLPFFSKLNLMHHAEDIRALGCTVAIAYVPRIETH